MSTFNHFRNKRLAHTMSRSSYDQSWNPFRHVAWDRPGHRADTWDGGGRLEEQPQDQQGRTDMLTHAQSEPVPRTPVAQDLSTAETMTGSRDQDDSTREIGGDKVSSQRSLDGESPKLRNRKLEEDTPKAEVDNEDDNGKKKPVTKQKSGLIRHVRPKTPFTFANQLQRTLLNSWINLLLVAAPVGIALNYVPSVSRIVVFVVNFIAIIPLAAMLSFATEEIALRTGETLGGLLNATFGNAVELIVAIIALKDDKVRIVQTSLIGSILSNLLLVLGMCFFFGGLRRKEQHFNHVVAQTAASLLALAAASVIVPTIFDYATDASDADIAKLSRGTSVILLLVYGAYLFFQLKTHQSVFNEESQKVPAKPWSRGSNSGPTLGKGIVAPSALIGPGMPDHDVNEQMSKTMQESPKQDLAEDNDDDEDEPQLFFAVAIATLTASTVVIALCAEYMVNGIDAVTQSGGLTEEFVGLILLPIVGNAAEHATAVTVAVKDKMDLAIGVAVGSSMQVALFLIPLIVIIGWGMGMTDMNLSFDFFQIATMFFAVLLVNSLISDGKSHWLEGFLLNCLYAIIAVCAFFYPDS